MHPVGAKVHASVATTRMSLQTEAAQIVVAGHVVLTHSGIFESVAHSSQEKLTPPLAAAYAVACPSSPASALPRCWFARVWSAAPCRAFCVSELCPCLTRLAVAYAHVIASAWYCMLVRGSA